MLCTKKKKRKKHRQLEVFPVSEKTACTGRRDDDDDGSGTMAETYVFANNKGGSGKSTIAFQLAASLAKQRPKTQVLAIDLSLYSDLTTMLCGGTSRPSLLAASRGAQTALEGTSKDERVEGLLRALATGKQGGMTDEDAQVSGLFGGWNPFSPSKPRANASSGADASGEKPIDLKRFAVRPVDLLEEVDKGGDVPWTLPGNLWVCCSCGELPLGPQEVPDAVRRLRAAIAALPQNWIVVIDTDHLAKAPVSELAFCSASKLVLPLSIDDNDFSRLFIDPTGNALFDVLEALEGREPGWLQAKVHKVVFNSILHYQNAPSQNDGVSLPFTPAKACIQQMKNMCDQMYSVHEADDKLVRFFSEGHKCGSVEDFRARYFSGMRKASEIVMNASKLLGCPICVLPSGPIAIDALSCNIDAKVLGALQNEVDLLTRSVFS